MKPAIAIPATAALVYRAWSRKSLTPVGIVVAAATAAAHAVHPWSVFFALLVAFFLSGTAATKVKHDVKARLTQSSSGASGGEGARTHVQVLANSVVASVLILLHTYQLSRSEKRRTECWASGTDLPVIGIIANYAAVAADTFSSELGILSTSRPRLITAPWRVVPPGTNGGVTIFGLLAGLLGAFIISVTALVLTPFCSDWPPSSKATFVAGMTLVGLSGSLLDSFLGAVLQASVVDVRTGKIVEGDGGRKVPVHGAGSPRMKQRVQVRSAVVSHEQGPGSVASSSGVEAGGAPAAKVRAAEKAGRILPEDGKHHESRRIETGRDLLSNNGVNLLMATLASLAAMVGTAFIWDIPLSAAFTVF